MAAAQVPAALPVPGQAGRADRGVRARPPKVIPRGLFTAMFLARLAYEKYVLGRPLHRIIAALAADGLDVAEGTLVGALQQVVPLLAPWAEAIEAHVALQATSVPTRPAGGCSPIPRQGREPLVAVGVRDR